MMVRTRMPLIFGFALAWGWMAFGAMMPGTKVVSAADIYVDNVLGSDLNLGISPNLGTGTGGPVATIAKALRIANKGDRIVLAHHEDQPYRESVTLQGGNNSGWSDGHFVIEGNGATLDGSAVVPLDAWEHTVEDVFRFTPRQKVYHQLFINDRPLTRAPIYSEGELDQMDPLHWTLLDGAIYFKSERRTGPGSYRLTYTSQPVGITLYQVRHVIINNLTIQGFQLDGINAHDNVQDVTINNVVGRGNGRSGISIGGASRVTINGALLGNNGEAQLRTEGYSKTKIRRSTILDNTAIDIDQRGGLIDRDGEVTQR